MLHLPLTKLFSTGVLLSFTLLSLLATSPPEPAPPVTTTIDFESLSSNGEIVRNQFASRGVIFQPILGVDYVQGIPIPNFTHSGAKGIELCFGVEFCRSKLDISFTAQQRRVKLWTGFTGALGDNEPVIMRAYDLNGNEVGVDVEILGPSSAAIPISRPLEVSVPSPLITRITVGFLRAEPSIGTMFNNGLAFDDLEFDDQGTAPQCPATQPPTLSVSQPTEGQIVVQNAFTLDGNLSTLDPFATLQIEATGGSGVRTFGPVFANSGHIQIFNVSSLLSPGPNTLRIIVRDCAGTTQVTRTVNFRAITRTVIRVIDESNVRVQTARVYANGEFLGLTDANGMFVVTPPLAAGTKLVARKLVAESSTYRDNHAQGSNQDWKFRVYTSNMNVNTDGSLSFHPVNYQSDPDAPQVIQVRRRNSLIGLHFVASFEWDASVAEMEIVKQKILETSKLLYNATDGQMFIEQAEVVDDAKFWQDADYRIYANQQLRAYVDSPLAGFFDDSFWHGSSWIHVRPSSPPAVYAHEFGHYGFGVKDEYKDDTPSVQCTTLLSDNSSGNVFGIGREKASCLMFDAGQPKICSHRSENPHKTGTKQGNSSCWTTLSGRFRDSSSNARWTLRTPDTRGAIPGSINGKNLPLNDMPPRVTFQNGSRPNLCQPITVLATHSNGTPHEGREIWVRTTYNRNILQGKTNAQGNITVTGVHVGDSVSGTKVQFANCTTTASLRPSEGPRKHEINVIPVGFSQDVEQGRQTLELGPAPFDIVTTLKPTREGAQVTVAVEDSAKRTVALAKPPVVRIQVPKVDGPPLQLRYQANTRSYSAVIERLPVDGEIEIAVEATDGRRQVVQSVSMFRVGRLDPQDETEITSPDGQLTIKIPAKGLPSYSRVSIGSTGTGFTSLPNGYSFVAGPFAVSSNSATQLYQPATLTFGLPKERGALASAGYAESSLRIFYFDGQKWNDLGGVVHPSPVDVVTGETRQLGIFALVGQRSEKSDRSVALTEIFTPKRARRLENLLAYLF